MISVTKPMWGCSSDRKQSADLLSPRSGVQVPPAPHLKLIHYGKHYKKSLVFVSELQLTNLTNLVGYWYLSGIPQDIYIKMYLIVYL
jgi:hypothetical protein